MRAVSRRRRNLFGCALLFVVGFVSTGVGSNLFFASATSGPTSSGSGTTPSTVCDSSTSTPNLGVYAGPGSQSGVASFESATGSHVSWASDYLPGNNGFAGMTSASALSWLLDDWDGSGCQLVLGVPIIPTSSSGTPAGTLAGGAAGDYNSYYTTLAQTLVDAGDGGVTLRLGWEFDGGWFTWSVANDADALNFAAYWRQIVTTMRAVTGANFKFDWNPSGGATTWPINDAYPGDAYVDDVGLDRYDETWATPVTPQVAWNDLTTMQDGMNWLVSFGAAHDKPLTLPEWGESIRSDGHGVGDDPYFINQMKAWIDSHNVAFANYFNSDQPPSQYDALTDGKFPNALSAFGSDFGSTATGDVGSPPPATTSTTTTTTAPPAPTTTTTAPPAPTTTTTAPPPPPTTTTTTQAPAVVLPPPSTTTTSSTTTTTVTTSLSAQSSSIGHTKVHRPKRKRQTVSGAANSSAVSSAAESTAPTSSSSTSSGVLSFAQLTAGFHWPWVSANGVPVPPPAARHAHTK
jgi:hypothetical protein